MLDVLREQARTLRAGVDRLLGLLDRAGSLRPDPHAVPPDRGARIVRDMLQELTARLEGVRRLLSGMLDGPGPPSACKDESMV